MALFFSVIAAGCARAVSPLPLVPSAQSVPLGVTVIAPTVAATPASITPTAVGTLASVAPASAKTPTRAPAATSAPKRTVPPLTLAVTAPKDESIVNTATIPVIGQSIASAVVSVNGDLANIDANGKFQKTITLDEGPNSIEVVASDTSGKELDVILTIIYQP